MPTDPGKPGSLSILVVMDYVAETSTGFELISSSDLCLYFIVVCSAGADYKLVDYMYFSFYLC